MKKTLFLAALSTALLSQAQAATPVKIATISALSGPVSNLGIQMKNGAQLAVNEMKPQFAKLGLTLSLVAYDDQADPTTGTSAARRAIADKAVLGMVGPLTSGVAIPATQAMAASHLVSVAPVATSEKVTDRGLKNVNRVCARDDAQGSAGGNFVSGTLKAKTVYVLNDKTPYGQGMAAEAEKAMKAKGVRVVQSEGVAAEERDFTAVITKIQTLKPEAIYFAGMYGQIGPFTQQLRAKGIQTPIVSGDGLDSPDFIKLAGNSVSNVYFTSLAPSLSAVPAAKKVADQYQKTFGAPIQGTGIMAYDSAKVLLTGMLNAAKANGNKAPTREQVEKAVRSGTFKGLTGDIKFNASGDRTSAKIYVEAIKNGKRSTTATLNISRK